MLQRAARDAFNAYELRYREPVTPWRWPSSIATSFRYFTTPEVSDNEHWQQAMATAQQRSIDQQAMIEAQTAQHQSELINQALRSINQTQQQREAE